MKCRYVAIEREYGSGGTKIANMLAEACGMKYINGQSTVTYFGAFLYRKAEG